MGKDSNFQHYSCPGLGRWGGGGAGGGRGHHQREEAAVQIRGLALGNEQLFLNFAFFSNSKFCPVDFCGTVSRILNQEDPLFYYGNYYPESSFLQKMFSNVPPPQKKKKRQNKAFLYSSAKIVFTQNYLKKNIFLVFSGFCCLLNMPFFIPFWPQNEKLQGYFFIKKTPKNPLETPAPKTRI